MTLTFQEGLTVDETIKIFTDAGVGDRDRFIDAINNYDYDYRFVKELNDWESIPGRKYRLEGYLYPDTYDFYTDSDESFIISKLLSNFDRKFEDNPTPIPDGDGGDLSEYFMLKLRLAQGISEDEIIKKYNHSFSESFLKKAKEFESYGVLKIQNKTLSLTKQGFLISNTIISELEALL